MKIDTINWHEVQTYYDSGNTLADIYKVFNFSSEILTSAKRAGLFVCRSKQDQQILAKSGSTVLSDRTLRLQQLAILYNDGKSQKELYKLGYTFSEYQSAKKLGLFIPRSASDAMMNRIKNHGPNTGVMTDSAKQDLSLRQSLNNSGGKCKWFVVAGQTVQGTWERDIALKFEELKIKWYKPKVHKDIWPYIIDGITKMYTPDFYLPDYDLYLEVKGYWWGRDKEKMNIVKSLHADKKLIIIEKNEYKKILRGELVW